MSVSRALCFFLVVSCGGGSTAGVSDAKLDAKPDPKPNAGPDAKPDAKPDAQPDTATQCSPEHADALARTLADGCAPPITADSASLDTRKLARAGWATTPVGVLDGLVIELTTSGVMRSGKAEPISAESLRDDHRSRSTPGSTEGSRFVAAIHGDVPLSKVQELFAALDEASLGKGTLLLASSTLPHAPGPLHPEVHARLSKKLTTTMPDRAIRIAEQLEAEIAGCPALIEAMHTAATIARNARCEPATRAVAKAIVDCGCPAWEPTVVTWLQLADDRIDAPQFHAEPIEIASAHPTKVDGAQTWSDFIASRTSPLGTLWFDVEGGVLGRKTWIIAGQGGVQEIDLDGKVLRTIASGPARSPRWLADRSKLVFLAKDPARDAFTDLRVMDVASGTHRSLVMLSDRPPCPLSTYAASGDSPPTLSLTNEDELWVTRDSEHVCAVLADHEADLRRAARAIDVTVADGSVFERVLAGADGCGADERMPADCSDQAWPGYIGESPFPKHSVVSKAPGGQWLLVLVASEMGDVSHNQYVLYEVATKALYPLPRDGSHAWPKPARLNLAKHDGATFVDGLGDFGGSEAMGWIGDAHLFIGRTLFIAGKGIVELGGDPAR